MSHFGFEVLRVLSAARPDQLGGHVVASAVSISRLLWMARVATTLGLVLLWFAGELEQLAGANTSRDKDEGESKDAGENTGDQAGAALNSVSPASVSSAHPVRCRWCLQEVLFCPEGGTLNEDGSVHQCGAFPIARPRLKRERRAAPEGAAGARKTRPVHPEPEAT